MNKLTLFVGMYIAVMIPQPILANSVLESFTVTTFNAIVSEFTETSVQLRSENNSYFVKLEPNKKGRVIFSLSDIRYRSSSRLSNLCFGVRITGYHNTEVIHPIISVDDINDKVIIDQNTIRFQRISGSLPIMFDEEVDSINLEFFNSIGIDVHQYLKIDDLSIVPLLDIHANPQLINCQGNSIMIGIDGSSSIDNRERGVIGNQLLNFIKRPAHSQDSSTICIMEFGTEVHALTESAEKSTLIQSIKKYKRGKNYNTKNTSWTNWSAAFDEAIARKPEIFIFVTDGWSNWQDKSPASFSAQYANLIAKSNVLKASGTRLLFITSGLESNGAAKSNLYPFLNSDLTIELNGDKLNRDASLYDVDLITMREFSTLSDINFSSIFRCPVDFVEVSPR